MDASAKRSSYVRIFVPLHVIHAVLSFGIIIALIQVQISNNSRFEKFEANCQCNLNRDDSSGNSEEIVQRKTPSSKPFMHVRRSTELDEDGEITEFLSKTSKGINSSFDETWNKTTRERNGTSKVADMTDYTKENEENYNVSGVQGRIKNDTSKGLEKDFINGGEDMTNTDLEGNVTDAELAKKMTNVTEVHGYRKTVESSYQNKTENTTPQTEGKDQILITTLSGLAGQSETNNASNNSSSGQENQGISVDNATTAGGDRQQQKTNQSRELPQKHLNRNGMRYLKGEVDLMLCLDELKVILDDYMISDKHSSSQGSKGSCKILKGERGEKGCAGTSFAAPSFITRPQSVVFNERETAVLTCSAVANPRAEITWYRGSTQISDNHQGSYSHRYRVDNRDVTPKASNRAKYCPSEIPHTVIQSTLMIRNSNGSDTGTYVCKGHNILGASRFEIHALIQVYVEFVTIPSNITVVQGDDVKLICRASGVPQPRITWYRKDGGPMPLHHNITMGDLYIVDIKKEQEGSLVCKATNILGSQTTEATITVNVFPKITSFLDQPITVNESTSLILPCNATGYPTPDIHWTKRKDSLPDDRHTYNGQFLNVSNVVYEDRGVYTCFANNTVGVVNRSVEVIVQVSPKIIQRPSKFETGYLSLSKRLNFQVFSFPEATISWTRPLWTLQHDERFTVANRSLVISNVTSTDLGLYEVMARNLLGEVKASTFLVVQEPVAPWVRLTPTETTVAVIPGERIAKKCTAFGRPSPMILWKRNGRTLLNTTSTSLTLSISSIQQHQFGKYSCEASNEFGLASQDFDVTEILVNVVSTNCEHSKINSGSGYIRTPGYPGRSSRSYSCTWKISSNFRVRLSFDRSNFDSGDQVYIYDGGSSSSKQLGSYSGYSWVTESVTSSSRMLYITFNSGYRRYSYTYRRGFSAKYQGIL